MSHNETRILFIFKGNLNYYTMKKLVAVFALAAVLGGMSTQAFAQEGEKEKAKTEKKCDKKKCCKKKCDTKKKG